MSKIATDRACCALLAATLLACAPPAVFADDSVKWWPHPRWGADDQAGGTNWITPAKVLDALKLVRTGQIYELGQVYDRDMPRYGDRTFALFIPSSPTGGPFGANALVYHDDFLCTEIGNIGTQLDGLGHVGTRVSADDGTQTDVFYNGVTLDEMRNPYGLQKLGIHNAGPIVTRGILIDVAGWKGVPRLPNSYEVTVDDVRGALERQGLSEDAIRPGDALFFRYGWSTLWNDPDAYNDRPPGIGLAVAAWAAAKEPALVGSDQWGLEVQPDPNGLVFPVHQLLLTRHGIYNLENMRLETLAADGVYTFAFVFTPLPIKGGVGSPGRPIAIR